MYLTQQERIVFAVLSVTLLCGTALNYCVKKQMRITHIISFIEEGRYIRKIDVNTATHRELTAVPGIGDRTAWHILSRRKEKGPFRTLRELAEVDTIGKRNFARIKHYLKIGGQE